MYTHKCFYSEVAFGKCFNESHLMYAILIFNFFCTHAIQFACTLNIKTWTVFDESDHVILLVSSLEAHTCIIIYLVDPAMTHELHNIYHHHHPTLCLSALYRSSKYVVYTPRSLSVRTIVYFAKRLQLYIRIIISSYIIHNVHITHV